MVGFGCRVGVEERGRWVGLPAVTEVNPPGVSPHPSADLAKATGLRVGVGAAPARGGLPVPSPPPPRPALPPPPAGHCLSPPACPLRRPPGSGRPGGGEAPGAALAAIFCSCRGPGSAERGGARSRLRPRAAVEGAWGAWSPAGAAGGRGHGGARPAGACALPGCSAGGAGTLRVASARDPTLSPPSCTPPGALPKPRCRRQSRLGAPAALPGAPQTRSRIPCPPLGPERPASGGPPWAQATVQSQRAFGIPLHAGPSPLPSPGPPWLREEGTAEPGPGHLPGSAFISEGWRGWGRVTTSGALSSLTLWPASRRSVRH